MKSFLILLFVVILDILLLSFVAYIPPSHAREDPNPVINRGGEMKSSCVNNYYLRTGKLCLERKDYAKAVEALELAVLLEPNNEEAQTLLRESRRLLEGERSHARSQDDKRRPGETAAAPSGDISVLIQNTYTAIKEERYDDALGLTDSILAKDATNKEALYLKEKINDIRHRRTAEELKTKYTREKLKGVEYLKEASVPYHDTIRFPAKEHWEDISNRNLPELGRIIEENKRKTEQLRLIPNPLEGPLPKVVEDALNTTISFEFLDTPLKDIVVFLREKTNINMIIDAEAGNAQVTLKLKDVSVKTALKYILPKGYEYVIEGDIIHIYKQKMELRVYDVRDILINLDDKEPLKFDITAAATSQLSMTRTEEAKVKDASNRVLDLIEQIITTIEPSSWSNNANVVGITTSGEQRRINIPGQGEGSIMSRVGQPGDLVVVNCRYVHEQIEALLASLRSAQNLQVSIEVRFIKVSDNFLEDIGSNITKFFSDKTTVTLGADSISGNLSGNEINGLDLNYSILNDSMLKGILRAVQESKDSEILTSPRITLSNTQRGNIAVIKTINYVQSTSVSEGIVTPVIGTIPEGTTFDVRPIVSADRKYVYLEVTPSIFQVEEITEFTFSGLTSDVSVGSGGNGTTNIPPEQTVQLPKVNVSQVSVTVCVPDKGTLMIGGLGAITKETLTSGIPLLSKIPVLKRLFSRDKKTNEKSNLIILLKPTILIKEEQETNFFGQSKKIQLTTESDNEN